MTTLKKLIASGAFSLTLVANAAFANDLETVQVFYDLLSNPSSEEQATAFLNISSANWKSVGDYSKQNKTREAFLGQVGGFGKIIPNLQWSVQEMHQSGNTVTVRSRATGTPIAPFFGVDGQGRSFDIMTIDIHELEDGLIVRSYHVEDWSGAVRQLSGR